MQWYQHTLPAKLRLVLDEYLGQLPVAQYGNEKDEPVFKEKYQCMSCGEETLWAIYDPRNPVAGCTNSSCPVEERMGIFDLLASFWDSDSEGNLPEESSERKKVLGKEMNELSAAYLKAEERQQAEFVEAERRHREEAEKAREWWSSEAEGWKREARAQESRGEELESSLKDLAAKLRRGVDETALSRGLAWGSFGFVCSMFALGFFIRRAEAQMMLEWNVTYQIMYLGLLSFPLAYLLYANVYKRISDAGQRNQQPESLREIVDWKVGVLWAWKAAAFCLLPYMGVGIFADYAYRSEWF